MLTRNRLSNVSFFVCSAGELVILAILAGILVGIHADRDTESNTRAFSIVCAYSAGAWSKFLSTTAYVMLQLTLSMRNSACRNPLVLHRATSTRSSTAPRHLLYNHTVRHFSPFTLSGPVLISARPCSFKQIYHAFGLCLRLKQTFIYLVGSHCVKRLAIRWLMMVLYSWHSSCSPIR